MLFFLGLVAGLFIPVMANPRMGLATHLEGVMNGIFLIVLGLIWHRMVLPDKWFSVTFGLAIFGSFANYIAVLIAAITGAGKLMPIAGGKEGAPVTEAIISFLLITLALAMLAVCLIVLAGIYRQIKLKA
jgi:hydroxylaminobenzene mutase